MSLGEEDAFIKAMRHGELVRDVNNKIALFQNTGDPRFFWKAFVLLREAGEDIPESFMHQITVWGKALIPAATPHQVATAVQMIGTEKRHIGPKHSAAYEHRWRIASEVERVKKLYKVNLATSIDVVARDRNLTVAKVKKAYHDTFTGPAKKAKATEKEADRSLDATLNAWR